MILPEFGIGVKTGEADPLDPVVGLKITSDREPLLKAMKRPCLLLLLLCALSVSSSAAEKPNLLMVFIDDMGWGDFSCFGNKDAQTPNIDRIARNGAILADSFFGNALSTPSRATLLTRRQGRSMAFSRIAANSTTACGCGRACSARSAVR